MQQNNPTELYKEEYKNIFSKKGVGVKYAVVVSAFIEEQIFLLAKCFLENNTVAYKPEPRQAYSQSLNILKANTKLVSKEIKQLKVFRDARSKAIHGIFNGMTRDEWEKQNKKVIEEGRLIIKNLDGKLYPKR